MFEPLYVSNVKNFFEEQGIFLKKDFLRIISIQNKHDFAMRSVETFYRKAEKIARLNSCKIFFDGLNNWVKGLNLFSLCAIGSNFFLVYCFVEDTYYYCYQNIFYVNEKRIQHYTNENLGVMFMQLPDSLACSWFLCNKLDLIKIPSNSLFFPFLSHFPHLNDGIFLKQSVNIDQVERARAIWSKISLY